MQFQAKEFHTQGQCHYYNGKFVARTKYGGWGAFKKFLIKNFTPSEYFAQIEAGHAPLHILNAKGYISPNMAKALAREQG